MVQGLDIEVLIRGNSQCLPDKKAHCWALYLFSIISLCNSWTYPFPSPSFAGWLFSLQGEVMRVSVHAGLLPVLSSTLTECMHRFPDAVVHNDEGGQGISPPPAKERIEDESHQDRSSELSIDHGHTSFGEQNLIL